MSQNSKMIGIMLIVVGILVFAGCAAISVFSTMGAEQGTTSGAVLGIVLSLFVALVPVGGGIFLLVRSRSETASQADSARLRKILDVVKTRGQVDISDLVFELNTTTDQVRSDLYQMVGMGVFSGYVNWDKGVIYSQDASQLRGRTTCPNCGGQLELGGKGVITCPYCGTDIFL
ncbi:MAG: hypothetical protein KDI79_27090 [Anaerolineae bacterium]|nr:hypothetical protein [Anaerolineae bacterium]